MQTSYVLKTTKIESQTARLMSGWNDPLYGDICPWIEAISETQQYWISRSSVHLTRYVCCFFSDDPSASLHLDGKLDFVSSVDITVIFDIM
jgi:hypothetical protein